MGSIVKELGDLEPDQLVPGVDPGFLTPFLYFPEIIREIPLFFRFPAEACHRFHYIILLMDKRVFAAINLPLEIKAEIEAALFEAEPLWKGIISPRILSRENWHITMGFFGNRNEAEIELVKEAIKETAQLPKPEIIIRKMVFGPTKRPEARMIWLEVESGDLEKAKKSFDQSLEKRGLALENKRFSPHITLARFETANFSRLPPLEKEINLCFRAKSLDLMESRLSSKGSVYDLVSEIDFGEAK